MSNLNEWQLMELAEDLEPGDAVAVELEDGDSTEMVLIGADKGAVKLLDQDGRYWRFSQQSLESLSDDNAFITGRGTEELDTRAILRKARG